MKRFGAFEGVESESGPVVTAFRVCRFYLSEPCCGRPISIRPFKGGATETLAMIADKEAEEARELKKEHKDHHWELSTEESKRNIEASAEKKKAAEDAVAAAPDTSATEETAGDASFRTPEKAKHGSAEVAFEAAMEKMRLTDSARRALRLEQFDAETLLMLCNPGEGGDAEAELSQMGVKKGDRIKILRWHHTFGSALDVNSPAHRGGGH